MSTVTVNIKDFPKVLKEFSTKSLKQQRDAVIQGIIDSLPDVVKNSPVDTGLYAASWDLAIETTEVLLGNTSPHAPIIEYGARPFTPPLGPLLQWAKRVLGDASQPPNYSSRVWALAKHTQDKIAREGMEPKAVMRNSIPLILDNIAKALRKV